MFSQTLEYALRAVVCLAQAYPLPLTAQQIAERGKVPASYASKVLQSLVRGGLVTAARGIGGGYALAAVPAEMSVLDVVNAVEPLKRIITCPLGLPSHGKNLCALHARLDQILAQTERSLGETSIADLLGSKAKASVLCEAAPIQLTHAGKKRKSA